MLRELNGQTSLPCACWQLGDQYSPSGALDGGVVGNLVVGLWGVGMFCCARDRHATRVLLKKTQAAIDEGGQTEKP